MAQLVERSSVMLNISYRLSLLVLILGMVVVSGCGGSKPLTVTTSVVPYTQEETLARDAAASARYRLRSGDVVSLHFKYESDLNQNNLIVLPDGYLSVKGLDSGVQAAGLTVEELDTALTSDFGEDFRNPALSVGVQEISDPEVYVMGMVKSPGMYQLPWKGSGVLQAISMAGGFDEDANKSETAVLRATDEGFMIRVVDLSGVEVLGLSDLAMLDIQPYDVIYVPRSSLGTFAYLSEAVFGSALNMSQFFWDIYAIANLNKIDRIVR